VLGVEGLKTADHDLGGETIAAEGATLLSHGAASLRIESEGDDGIGQRGDVAGSHEDAGLARKHDLRCAVKLIGDGGTTRQERLWDGAGQTLAERGVYQEIHGRHRFRDPVGGKEPREDDTVADSEFAREVFERLSKDAVADEEEAQVGDFARGDGGRPQDVIVAFELEQTRNLPDDDVVVLEAEAPAGIPQKG